MKQKMLLTLALLLCIAVLLPVANAEETTPAPSFGDWLDGAVSSVENWAKGSGELEVRGQAVLTVVPDTVAIRIGVAVERENEKDAQAEANAIIGDVTEAVLALGVPENQIATSGYSVSPVYDYLDSGRKLRGYSAMISLRVTVMDFALINEILDVSVKKGANDIGGLEYSYSEEGEVYKQALSEAIVAAKGKAEAMAETAGVTLNTLLALREVSQASAYVNSYANVAYDVAESESRVMAGEIQISANVVLVYEVK